MRITVDIEDDVLVELMKITGDKNKSPAVARAVTEFWCAANKRGNSAG